MSSRTLYSQHPVSLRIFRSLPGSRLRSFIAGQIQHPTVHIFLCTSAQIDAPCRLEAHYVRNIKLKKNVIVLHSTGPLSRMYSSSTFYAQNPALEIVDQQEKRECLSTHTCTNRMFSRTKTLYAQHLSPVLAYDFLSRCKFSSLASTPLYSSINRLYAQNPVFEIVRWESVKVYLHIHMYNGNIQQNPLCVEFCVTISHLSPFLACVFSSRCKFTTLTSTPLYSSRLYGKKTLLKERLYPR